MLATCNRVEIYADVDRFHGSVEAVSRMLCERADEAPEDVATAPLRALRRRRGLAPVPRRLRPGLDGRRRGPDPRPGPRGAPRSARSPAPSGPPSTCSSSRRCGSASASHAETDIDHVAPVAGRRRAGPRRRRGRRRSAASGCWSSAPARWPALAAATVVRARARPTSWSPTAPRRTPAGSPSSTTVAPSRWPTLASRARRRPTC